MKKLICLLFLLFGFALPSKATFLLLNYYGTNGTSVVDAHVKSIADAAIATNTQAGLAPLLTNNAQWLTNLQGSNIAGTKYTGILSNTCPGNGTNFMYFTNGILIKNVNGAMP